MAAGNEVFGSGEFSVENIRFERALFVKNEEYVKAQISIDPETRTATVQPGVILSDLQLAAAPHGLRFGPDPSTQARCTIGGMIGNNACGAHALAYGRTGDNLTSLSLVLAGSEPLQASTLERAGPITTPLRSLVRDNLARRISINPRLMVS